MYHHHVFIPFFTGIGGLLLLIFVIPYFLPTIIAFIRRKDNAGSIFILNFLLGWTLIGWIASLVWALSADKQTIIVNNNNIPATQQATQYTSPTLQSKMDNGLSKAPSSPDKFDQLRQLKQLLDEGILTEEEFNKQKASILG